MFHSQRSLDIEPLDAMARFSWEHAPALCSEGCAAYHRTWSLIRLLNSGARLPVGEPFYEQGLAPLRSAAAPRVLISGGADTGLTALAISAMKEAAGRTEFIFADMCKTPVAQNKLMAERLGLNLQAIATDIVALDIAPVDAVLAHSFLTFIPKERRPAVIAAWARLLKPGGVVLFSNGVVPRPGTPRKPKDPARRVALAGKVRIAAQEWGMSTAELDELEALVCIDPMPQPLPEHCSEGEYRDMLHEAGFALELLAFDTEVAIVGPLSTRPQAERNLRIGFQARKRA